MTCDPVQAFVARGKNEKRRLMLVGGAGASKKCRRASGHGRDPSGTLRG
jgi:hypothetical protein